MKKEELLKLDGMTEELASKIAEMSATEMSGMVPKDRLNDVIRERDIAKNDYSATLKKLGELEKETKDIDVAGMQKKIADLQDEATTNMEKHEAEIMALKIDNAVNSALNGANALNIKAAKALLNLEGAELDEDGTVKGLADQINALKEADDSKMLFGSQQLKGAHMGESGTEPNAPAALDYSKMSYEQIAQSMESGN